MIPLAHPLAVPMQADSVLSPRVTYSHVAPFTSGGERDPDALHFPLPYREGGEGRVTFEGLDSLRVCRGEYLPYEYAVPFTRGDWVYEVSDSPWLAERHAYEVGHYQTPLIGFYRHYLFAFHDEYVEAIAQGIWFDRPDPAGLPKTLPPSSRTRSSALSGSTSSTWCSTDRAANRPACGFAPSTAASGPR